MALGALDIIIAADTAQLRKGMDTAVGIMQSSTKTMENVAKTAGTAIAGYFTFSAIKDSVTNTLDLADSLGKLNQKVGISVDLLYSMQAQAKLSDVEFQTLEKSLLKFNKGLGTASMGSGDTTNALKNLNIELKDSSGHLKTSDQYLFEVADRFKGMPDGIAKSTLAMQLFGKSGADMIPLLNGGGESLKEFTGVMNNETAKAAERLNDSFTRMELSFEGNKTKILTGMLPAIESLSGSFEDFAVWMNTHEDDIKSFTDHAGADLTALGMVGHDVFGLISDTSADMLKVLNGVFSAIPNMIGESSNDAINNFGFFEYFILGLSTATNGVKQFIANAKMAYATASEIQAKYGSVGGLITNGGSRAAEARYDYAVAKSEAKDATNNVADTYNTLLGLKKQFVAKSSEIKLPFPADLEDFDKNSTITKKAASDRLKTLEEEQKIRKGYLDSYAEMEAKTAIEEYDNKLKYLEVYADMEAKLAIEQYENELKYLDAYSEMEAKAAIKKYEEQNKFLVDLFGDVEKAMDNQLFDAMTGKWTDFGDWFKDFWSSLSTSIMRAFSAQMSDSLMNTMKGAMGMETSGGGIQNIFSQFGLFGGSSQGSNAINVGVGTTLTSDQVARFGGTSGESFTTNSGTVISSSGQILTAGTDITDIAKSVPTSTYASYIQDAYGTVSGWFGAGGGLSSAELAAGEMANAGTATAGSSASSGLLGTAGTALGWAAFFKTLSGFLWSDNGLNKLFGTDYGTIAHDTMKYGAGSYDWSSGQLNSGYGYLTDSSLWARNASYMNPYNLPQMAGYDSRDWARMSYAAQINPLSAITGHMDPIFAGIIGGLFGSGETTSMMLQGEQYNRTNIGTSSEEYSSGNQTGWLYSSTDGGLFGGGGDSFLQLTQALPQSALDGIKSYIGAFNNILSEMGVAEKMIVAGGNFSSVQQFLDTNVLYTFFDKLTDADSVAVTNVWKDYATSISKSTMEAFNEVVGGMIGYKRSFEEWYLGSGTIEQLRFTANYLQNDLEKYAKSIGAVGVTTDNFLTKYEDAMTALYTPETSEAWQKLGQSLMAATDASKALQNQVSSVIAPQDMILSKSTDATNIFQTISTQTDNMKYSFAEMIQILRKILYNQQFGLQPV